MSPAAFREILGSISKVNLRKLNWDTSSKNGKVNDGCAITVLLKAR